MQIIRIETNIRTTDIRDNFEQELIYELSKTMEIPSDNFLVIFESAKRITSTSTAGGRESALAMVTFTTSRPTSQTENDTYAKKLSTFFKEHLKLDNDQIFIIFDYKDSKNMATRGKTIASLYS